VKIWFDILTPKQIMFFSPAIDILKRQNIDILCTSRKYREANELSKLKGLDLLLVGSHGGANLYNKLYQSTNRIIELSKIINNFSPDLVISFSSPEASRVSFGLGITHLGFNDSPHAEAVARLTIPLITKLFSPSMIPLSAWTKYGIPKDKIITYNGLDPVAWLIKRDTSSLSSSYPFTSTGTDSIIDAKKRNNKKNKNTESLANLRINPSKKTILVRLEESKAAYIINQQQKKITVSPLELIDYIVNHFGERNNIVILCRYQDQIREISKRYKNKAIVLTKVVDGLDLLKSIDVFIGAGGTMTAESALLGIPTISIAPVRFYIDDFLRKTGLVKRAFTTSQMVNSINSFLADEDYCSRLKIKATKILNEMEDPIEKLVSYVRSNS
jgi:predicted glycosyltransferase